MTEKLNEYAVNREPEKPRPRYQRWGIPTLVVGALGFIGALFAPDAKNWLLAGKLESEIVHATGLTPDGEIAKFTFNFVNRTNETIVINELQFDIEAKGHPSTNAANASSRPAWVADGLKLPSLAPGESSRRSAMRDLTLKPGEAGKIEQLLFPPTILEARTKGVYEVTSIIRHSAGTLKLPAESINVGRTVFDTHQIPTQFFRYTDAGTEAIGPDF